MSTAPRVVETANGLELTPELVSFEGLVARTMGPKEPIRLRFRTADGEILAIPLTPELYNQLTTDRFPGLVPRS